VTTTQKKLLNLGDHHLITSISLSPSFQIDHLKAMWEKPRPNYSEGVTVQNKIKSITSVIRQQYLSRRESRYTEEKEPFVITGCCPSATPKLLFLLAKDLPRFRTGKKTKHIPRQHHNVRIGFRRRGLRPSRGPDSAVSGVLPNIRLPPTPLHHTAGARGDDSGDCARLFRKRSWRWHRDEDEARGGVLRRWHGKQLRWWHRLSLAPVGLLQN